MIKAIQDFLTSGSLPILESKWSILASLAVIVSVIGGSIFALLKLLNKGEGGKSNKASVKNAKESQVTIDQKNE